MPSATPSVPPTAPSSQAQFVTTALLSFVHGSNDGQKQMGIITIALMAGGFLTVQEIPFWVRVVSAIAIAAGTVGGGWKIMVTLGRKIIRLRPIDSLGSQIASSGTIFLSTLAGAPVSSTQVVASSVMGVGAAQRVRDGPLVGWKAHAPLLGADHPSHGGPFGVPV